MTMQRTFAFGPYRLVPERQALLRHEAPVRIGSRAFDLLTALVLRAGELVTKAELIAHAWPNLHVEEANLKVNMAGLRRVLEGGDASPPYIATVTGRGYRFVAPVQGPDCPATALSIQDHFSLTEECVAQATAPIDAFDAAVQIGTAAEILLKAWLRHATLLTAGSNHSLMQAMNGALTLSAQLGDTESHLRCLRTIGLYQHLNGEHTAALATFTAYASIAAQAVQASAREREAKLPSLMHA